MLKCWDLGQTAVHGKQPLGGGEMGLSFLWSSAPDRLNDPEQQTPHQGSSPNHHNNGNKLKS